MHTYIHIHMYTPWRRLFWRYSSTISSTTGMPVTSSYILCHIIIHTMPHHHTRPNHQPQAYPSWTSGPGCEATRPQARRAAAPIHAKKKSKRLGSPSRVRLDNGSLACVCVCVCVHTFIYTYTYIHDRFEGVYMYMYILLQCLYYTVSLLHIYIYIYT